MLLTCYNVNCFSQEIIVELLKDAMLEHPQSPGFLIDGFPRELGQAKQFEDEVTLKPFLWSSR